MALIPPILDDRTYQQLRDELVQRIPVYNPEWTDHNESDVGITLLELVAFLGESILFRLNQIPDTTKVAFLRMLGVEPRTADTARTIVTATTDVATGIVVPRGAEAKAGAVLFETEADITVWPLEAVGVGKKPAAPGSYDPDRMQHVLSNAKLGLTKSAPYETFELAADPTASEAQPLEVAKTVDGSLWIALLGTTEIDPTKLGGHGVFLGIAFDAAVPATFDLATTTTKFDEVLVADPPEMLWQIWDPVAGMTTVAVGDDTTRGLTTTGVIEVILPDRLPPVTGDPHPDKRGLGSSPPPHTDLDRERRTVAWLCVSRPSVAHTDDVIGTVTWVGVNAIPVVQARSATPELLGTGTGDSDQRYTLARRPVLPGTIRLQVEEPDGWVDWTETPAYVRGGHDDRYFTLDSAAGAVTFDRTRVPQAGQRIRTLTYRYGGGIAGNVPAKAITSIGGVGGVRDVINPIPASGGADPATLDGALDQVPAEIHRRDRAVTADDFTDFALEVTGVGRADTLGHFNPDTPDDTAAGAVSVVVFPATDLGTPDTPMPDFDLLRQVARHLDVRRLVTTELYVIPPTYRRIAVSFGVVVRAGYQFDAVRRYLETLIGQYLSPLPPFGPTGRGWPLGRTVRSAELMSVAVQVDGVDYISGIRMAVFDNDAFVPADTVELKPWEVPALIDVTALADAPGDPGAGYTPKPPVLEPVPVPPVVC